MALWLTYLKDAFHSRLSQGQVHKVSSGRLQLEATCEHQE